MGVSPTPGVSGPANGGAGVDGLSVGPAAVRPEPTSEDARVRALEDLGVLHTGPEERFDRITRLARRVFGVSSAAVTLVDRHVQHVKSLEGRHLGEVPRRDSFCNHALGTGRTLVVEDATVDERFADNPLVAGDPNIRFYAGHPLEAPGGHPVGALCLIDDRPRRFTDDERLLLEELADWVQEEMTRSRELEHAAEVQRALLPSRWPDLPGYDVAGTCLPARSVGGDFIDWYRTPDGDLASTLGDVMGKGLPAAIVMATVRGAMRLAGRNAEPGQAVQAAAATLYEDLDETTSLVTLCHSRLSPGTGVLRFADAGHGLMLLVRAGGSVVRPPRGGLPLGVLPGQAWREDQIELAEGDTVVAFSDGLLDLCGGTPDAALDQVTRSVVESASSGDVVRRFTALARMRPVLDDDVALLVVRRTA
ncbi:MULTISPECIES: PP2C family protein-serine/threonine phosphatase [unclassified Blastococcus]